MIARIFFTGIRLILGIASIFFGQLNTAGIRTFTIPTRSPFLKSNYRSHIHPENPINPKNPG
jgi:hypothetical protein